jgi:CTP synthase (UTP-ammonia lyase)
VVVPGWNLNELKVSYNDIVTDTKKREYSYLHMIVVRQNHRYLVDNIVVVVFEAHKIFVEGTSEEFVELPMVIELTLNNSSSPFEALAFEALAFEAFEAFEA